MREVRISPAGWAMGVLVLACLCGAGVEAAACTLGTWWGMMSDTFLTCSITQINWPAGCQNSAYKPGPDYIVAGVRGTTGGLSYYCSNGRALIACNFVQCVTSCNTGNYLSGSCTPGTTYVSMSFTYGSPTNVVLDGCTYTSCTLCTNGPANSYYNSSGAGPTSNCGWACNSGYVQSGSTCIIPPCNPGYYYNGATCLACSSGTYSPGGPYASVPSCPPCTNGNAYSTYTGTGTNATNCPVTCNAGAYLSGGFFCTPCAVGTYSAGGSATVCGACVATLSLGYAFTSNGVQHLWCGVQGQLRAKEPGHHKHQHDAGLEWDAASQDLLHHCSNSRRIFDVP